MEIAPALNALETVWIENRCLGWVARWERPDLPFPTLMIEIGDAGVVGRPHRISNFAPQQFLHAIRIIVVFTDAANRSLFAGEKQLLAVVGRRYIIACQSGNGSDNGTALERELQVGIPDG